MQRFPGKLACLLVVSTWLLITLGALAPLRGHELSPAIADISVGRAQATVEIELALEAFVARIDASGIGDTDDDPNAARYDALRALQPALLEEMLRRQWVGLRENLSLTAGGAPVPLELGAVSIPSVGDVDLVRNSRLTLSAALPRDGSEVRFGWTGNNGALILREAGAGVDGYAALLEGGQLSDPLPRRGGPAGGARGLVQSVLSGAGLILPQGADHVLFVLGLVLCAPGLRSLAGPAAGFALGLALGLVPAALGVPHVPAGLVEPLLAASVLAVGLAGLLRPGALPGRGALAFALAAAIGLLHGQGLAIAGGLLGGGPGLTQLFGTALGAGAALLGVGLAAALLLGLPALSRQRIARPASAAIALMGLVWLLDRGLGLGLLPGALAGLFPGPSPEMSPGLLPGASPGVLLGTLPGPSAGPLPA